MDYPYRVHTLYNGIRLIHKHTDSQVAHLGITIDVGSRDEERQENGMAHFIEHCIFKGTKKRSSSRILSRIDGVGGELNAYTTKEETAVFCTFLSKHYERATELLSDIIFNSVFPDKELDKEKSVIIEEINSYEDSPMELIYDEFESLVFGDTGLGRMILGTEKKVKSFSSSQVMDFIKKNWATNLIVISTVGDIKFEKWVRLIEKFFGYIPPKPINRQRKENYNYIPQHKELNRDTYQAHIMIGCPCYDYTSEKKVAFSLLNNVLGSSAMNSYLNMNVREKYGFTYLIESSYNAYSDNGIFQIYAGTDEQYIDKTLSLIKKGLQRFVDKRLTQSQIHKAKEQLKGQLSIQNDYNREEMLAIGKSLLNYNHVQSLEETFSDIDSISAEDILEVASEIFRIDNLSTIIYK
ncbi:MAG: pitrilysin family protein [Synergistales bacterium]|nr:pitrilysin family protein [Bacteroidales bacterium]MDY6434890.1 pitrilysin family protein [Synergistales bacterium]MDY6393214.1 pitrilysin family protein [Bacteroidales bacterium]MDY6395215.1 pitrilysin family protein [Bacteroidales bacterium]MDY6403432.1 pitrilysin family protein [Bacteroidales bacterium]